MNPIQNGLVKQTFLIGFTQLQVCLIQGTVLYLDFYMMFDLVPYDTMIKNLHDMKLTEHLLSGLKTGPLTSQNVAVSTDISKQGYCKRDPAGTGSWCNTI